jgi:hypothetical protein
MSSKIIFRNSQSALVDLREEPFHPSSFREVISKAEANEWAEEALNSSSNLWDFKFHHSEALKRLFLLVKKAPISAEGGKWDLRRFFIAFMDRYHKGLRGMQVEVIWRILPERALKTTPVRFARCSQYCYKQR